MKKFVSKQKNCFTSLIVSVVLCEILLRIDNKVIQSIGIALTPVIAILVYKVIRNDQRELENKKETN